MESNAAPANSNTNVNGNDLADERRRTVERDVARQHCIRTLRSIKAEAFAEQHGRQRDEGHEAKTAELDEREDHELAEDRPAGERIADYQTVTQVALVEVNRASRKSACFPLSVAIGRLSRSVTTMMMAAKTITASRAG